MQPSRLCEGREWPRLLFQCSLPSSSRDGNPLTAQLCVVLVVLFAPLSVDVFVVSTPPHPTPRTALHFVRWLLARDGGLPGQSLSPFHATAFWKKVGVAEMWWGKFCTVGLIK